MDEPTTDNSIETMLLKNNLFLMGIGLAAILGIFEAWQHSSLFLKAFGAIDWMVVFVVFCFGAVTTLLLQACMSPGTETKTNKRDFVIARLMFWLSFVAFFIAVLLFLGPNGVLTFDRPDMNQYLILYKNQTTQVCGVIGDSYGQPVSNCYAYDGKNFTPLDNQPQLPSFLSNKNWSSEPKNISSLFYK